MRRDDEGQVVGRHSVVSGRDPPTLLALVQEPFEQISGDTVLAEADRVSAISFRWDVRPCFLLPGKLPDPVRVLSA